MFVLVEGVVKASVTLREGTRFNISYIKGPSPVSLLRDEVSSRAKSPYSVRVESPEAVSYTHLGWEPAGERPRRGAPCSRKAVCRPDSASHDAKRPVGIDGASYG